LTISTRCAIVPAAYTPARVNQHFAIIRVNCDEISAEYTLYSLISYTGKARLLNIAQGGATREAITKAHIENFEILVPPKAISEQFSNLSKSISRQKEVLFLKNENLKQQRDMLLPKLISGKIGL
jgi:type I restriction enzyme S subunit